MELSNNTISYTNEEGLLESFNRLSVQRVQSCIFSDKDICLRVYFNDGTPMEIHCKSKDEANRFHRMIMVSEETKKEQEESPNPMDAFMDAVRKENLELVNRLLQDPRVDPSADDNCAIQSASTNGYLAVVNRLLQDPRVDPSANNNYGIQMAAAEGHLAVVNRLLQDPRTNPVDATNYALNESYNRGHLAVTTRLLQDPRVLASDHPLAKIVRALAS
jgi:hypothetical protein